MKLKLSIVIAIVLMQLFSLAQPAGNGTEFTIKGKITEQASGQPLEYANIAVFSQKDSALVTGTITSTGGYFAITISKPGQYYAVADFMGYEQVQTDPFLLDKSNLVVQLGNIRLKSNAIGLADVNVVSERPAVSYKIDRKVIDVSGNAAVQGGTAIDALENIPSVSTDVDGGVSLRGSSNFTVLIDGRQTQLTGSDALAQISASEISKIELITNPSAKYDPEGTSGIINIITKKGNLRGHSMVANASAGTHPSGSADVSYTYRAKKYSLTLTAGGRKSENVFTNTDERIYLIPTETGAARIDTRQEGTRLRSNYFARVGTDIFLTPHNTLSAGAGFNVMEFGRGYDARNSTADTAGTVTNVISQQHFGVSPVQMQYSLGDKQIFGEDDNHYLSIDLTYQTSTKGKNDDAQRYLADENWKKATLEQADEQSSNFENAYSLRSDLNYSRPLTKNSTAETGFSARKDVYRQDYARWTTGDLVNRYTDTARFDRNILAAYAIMKGALGTLQYSAGLRAEQTDQNIHTVRNNWDLNYNHLGWYPSLALTRAMTETSTLQASYSKRINRPHDHHMNPFPNISDGYVLMSPNPKLEPEYATSLELNFQKIHNSQQFSAETFYRYTDNKMTRVSESQGDTLVYMYKNIGSETDAGIELSATLKLSNWYSIQPTYTMSWNMVEGSYSGNDRQASSIFTRANLTQTFSMGRSTRLQVMAYYDGKVKTIEGETLPTAWCAAAIKRDFLDRKLTVSLKAEDIFASRKREKNTYTDSSEIHSLSLRDNRTFTIAASYRFNNQGKRAQESQKKANGDSGDMDY